MSEGVIDWEAPLDTGELIDSIYASVLQSTNKILHSCKFYHIEFLQMENASYELIAEQLQEAAKIIKDFSNWHPGDIEIVLTAEKASEYAKYVIDISLAIKDGDKGALTSLTKDLNERPFL